MDDEILLPDWRHAEPLRRVLGDPEQCNCYHLMSRTCGGAVYFSRQEQEQLMQHLRRMSDLLGVRLLTFAVMGNHFHALVEVPDKATTWQRFGDESVLLDHWSKFMPKQSMTELRAFLAHLRAQGMDGSRKADEIVARLRNRMGNLSWFGKEVKERFSKWYNKRHKRKGTLWMERFHSVLVEDGEALRTIAAYIDLNAVRAQVAQDPKDYRWCGYALAVAGDSEAQAGLCRVFGEPPSHWDSAIQEDGDGVDRRYRMFLFEWGGERWQPDGEGGIHVTLHGIDESLREQTLVAEQGRLQPKTLLLCRVRHFSQGLAFGHPEFVERVFERYRDRFGKDRQSGARKLRGAGWGTLSALRDLK